MNINPHDTITTEDSTASPIVNIETEKDTKEKVKVTVEEFKISGDVLVGKIKEIIRQSSVRRIIIKNEEGQTLIEIPMTVGVIGGVISAALFPVIAAVGVIGAMVAHLTVIIERQESSQPSEEEKDKA